ncbi:hypothetical protein HFO02_35385 [Rhizobium laguerreae]|uniref:hypothetical protein n=1 Tax=Rhizobium laguerreae TaxID=1076926 RepID=UPI001C929517|nr:hypothetical protein [Rhizobium laguerreae]MBY3328765.1 hypothetical protein [Rhizobium laguerreae]
MMLHVNGRLLLAATIFAGIAGSALAQQTSPNLDRPIIGDLKMPSVTPEEAERYLRARKVPQTDAVPIAAAQSRGDAKPLIRFNVETVLGHELPVSEITADGLKRADFATAKPNASAADEKQRKDAMGPTAVIRPLASGAVIQEHPPTVGSP